MMNKKRKRIYTGSSVNWAKMMNTIYGPNCKYKPSDYIKLSNYEE